MAKYFFYICTYYRITLACELSLFSPPSKVLFSVHMQNPDARVLTALRRPKSNLHVKSLSSRSAKGKRREEEKREMRGVDASTPTPLPLGDVSLFEFLIDLSGYCQTL